MYALWNDAVGTEFLILFEYETVRTDPRATSGSSSVKKACGYVLDMKSFVP